MRLSSIQMSGFKSFVEPTRVIFDAALTGVVGPNGCGKSNIIDAVRWVLGESARNIRGETLDDIIFDGSSSRQQLDQASIEIIIDNSAQRIGGEYAKFGEIKIRREVSRELERQSRYYINNTQVRRKDVSDLFQGTGLGRGNYAVIAQGMVQGLIEAKPEEMRKYLEEAAGISLYRERRRDTENRIRRTGENLARLQDILEDHEQRLRHLGRQKQQAEKSENLKRKHQQLENEWISLQLREQRAVLSVREEDHAGVEAQRALEEQKLATLREDKARKQEKYDQSRTAVEAAVVKHERLLGEADAMDRGMRAEREKHERMSKEIKRLETDIRELGESVARLQGELKQSREQRRRSASELTRARAARRTAETLREKQAGALRRCREKSDSLRDRQSDAERELSNEETALRQNEDELKHLRETAGAIGDGQDPHAALRDERDALEAAWRQCKAQLEQNGQRIGQARAQLGESEDALAGARERRTRAQGRLASLETLQQSGPAHDAEAHAEALRTMRLEGEPLMAQLEVEDDWEFAVEAVLAENLGAFCVEGLPETVDEQRIPGASALTLLDRSPSAAPRPDGASLASRVRSPFPLESLLGSVMTAETLEQAHAARRSLRPHQSVITRSGVWLGPDWVRLPAAASRAAGALERQREIEALGQELQRLEAAARKLEQRRQEAQRKLRREEERRPGLQEQADQAYQAFADVQARLQGFEGQIKRLDDLQRGIRQSRSNQRKLERRIESLGEDRARAQAELAAAEAAHRESEADVQRRADECRELQARVDTAQAQIDDRTMQLSRDRSALARARAQRKELPKELPAVQEDADLRQRLKEKRKEVGAAKKALDAARKESGRLGKSVRDLDQEITEANHRFNLLGQSLHGKDLERQKVRETCKQLLGRLREQEGDFEQIIETLPADAQAEQWEAKVLKLLARQENMPPINQMAAQEYDELLAQKEQEQARMEDVRQALEKLTRAMEKIDRETRERFRSTFGKVNEHLKQLFPRIIGEGGEANLVMTEQNLLTTGIEVRARPPGKRYRSMHMLSGGEQAMVAVSLVLSLFNLNPAPFCILDEVDAPLSDDNLLRFCQILAEMSERIQFIVVTHNKITMEHVEQLIGVTMNEPGVSRLVSVNVAQAMEMVEQAEAARA